MWTLFIVELSLLVIFALELIYALVKYNKMLQLLLKVMLGTFFFLLLTTTVIRFIIWYQTQGMDNLRLKLNLAG